MSSLRRFDAPGQQNQFPPLAGVKYFTKTDETEQDERTPDPKEDANESPVAKARREMLERHANAWKPKS